jgi:HEAT repeat protein
LTDAPSAQILRKSYSEETGAGRVQIGHALIACASRLAKRGDTTTALAIYNMLEKTPANPFLEAVALRGMAGVSGEKALPALLEALGSEGTPRQQVAAVALREMPGKSVSERLANAALKMQPQGQRLAVEILGDRADAAAAPTIIKLSHSEDPGVRIAALRACRTLGDAAAIPLLLETAANGSGPERAAARESLVGMRGASVEKALLNALDTATPKTQAEAIQALGLRAAAGINPRLLKAAHSPNASVRTAALRVLRDRGTIELLPTLVDLLIASPSDSRDAALDAVTQIARREGENPAGGESKAANLLLARLNAATRPSDRVALLTALGQVGGPGALAALRKASAEDPIEVRTAALSLLAEWPTDEPMNDLLRAARSLKEDRPRAIALRGYLRMVGNDEQRKPSATLALYKDAETLTTHPEERRLILSGLSKIPSLQALEYASNLMRDKEVQAEAELALADIGRGTLGAWPDKTRETLEPIAKSGINEEARKRAQAVLDSGKRFGDYIMAWEVSPSYQKEGTDFSRLFDMAFPPEEPGRTESVAWRPLPVGGNPEQPWLLDLLAQWGGEQRVAYLRTAVWSETARDLSLEMGSDDGLKVWWNGQVVLSHNTQRAVAPGQEKATVPLHAGWNLLLLKVTQNNQGWGAVARFANPDGTSVTGLRYALPSTLPAQ